jgi:hypothetical protein
VCVLWWGARSIAFLLRLYTCSDCCLTPGNRFVQHGHNDGDKPGASLYTATAWIDTLES